MTGKWLDTILFQAHSLKEFSNEGKMKAFYKSHLVRISPPPFLSKTVLKTNLEEFLLC